MKDVGQRTAEVAALKHAVPYIRMFKGKTFVLKAGGGALEREAATLAPDRADRGAAPGGHPRRAGARRRHAVDASSSRALGAEARFVEGRRVTDEKALEVAAMVLNGSVNTRLLAVCRRLGLPAVGVSGVDAGLIQARKRPPVRVGEEIGRLRLRGRRRGGRSQGAEPA